MTTSGNKIDFGVHLGRVRFPRILLEGILASPCCVLASFGLLLAVSWPFLASPGGPWDGSVVPFRLCYAALVVFGPRRHTSNLDLATFGAGPGWIFCASRMVFAHALGPCRWIVLLPFLRYRCVVRPLWPASAAAVSLLSGPERVTCRRQLRIAPILMIFGQK